MNDELLSALLDGECTPAELERLLAALDRDPELRRRYSRLSLARDSRAGLRLGGADLAFSDRVREALDREHGARVVRFPGRVRRSWLPGVGLAAAAAVAAVAILVLKPEVQAPAPVQLAATPVSRAAEPEPRWNQLNADANRQLRQYWLAYSQSRSQQGVGGTLGYARYAAYTADGAADGSQR